MSDTIKPTTVLGIIEKGRVERLAREQAEAAEIAKAAAAANAPTPSTTTAEPAQKAEPVFKAGAYDDERGVIPGFASAAGIVDRDGDRISKGDLLKMSYDFTGAPNRVFNANHGDPIEKAELVASLVGAPVLKSGRVMALGEELPPQSDSDPRVAKGEAVDPVVAMNIEKGRETHWYVEVRPNDPAIVEKAKSGGMAGFSVGIRATRTPVEA